MVVHICDRCLKPSTEDNVFEFKMTDSWPYKDHDRPPLEAMLCRQCLLGLRTAIWAAIAPLADRPTTVTLHYEKRV